MNSLALSALSFLLLYKYVALFLITYLAALLLPLPSSTSLMAASAFATQGYFYFPAVVIVALVANIFGDLTGFFIARHYGAQFLIRIKLGKILRSKKFIGLEKYLQDKAGLTIFSSRFVSELGPFVNILAGLSKIPFKTYFLYESMGEFVDVAIYAVAGYFLGSEWQSASGIISFVMIALVFSTFAIVFTRSYFKSLHTK